MSCEPIIQVQNISKCYQLYEQPSDRLKQFLWCGKRDFFREFWALRNINFTVQPGEVVGIVGRNGAGKSTLLQLICGTLTASSGEIAVRGRVAALLELGAGFNPEFSGRENVFMSAAIMGLSNAEISDRFNEIVDFSGIHDFIDQPVKTYSSGMYVRLAFAVAIHVDPDILVIDEALSVGDGAFARRSFDKIMELKDAGKTILFCSHSMYHIEAICNKAIWLNQGFIEMLADPATVVASYDNFLSEQSASGKDLVKKDAPATFAQPNSLNRITNVTLSVDCKQGESSCIETLVSTVTIKVCFNSDLSLPTPSVAIAILAKNGTLISGIGSQNDNVVLNRSRHDGCGCAELVMPQLPLLKGDYFINVFLACEQGIHVYDHAEGIAEFKVKQKGLEQGLVSLPHHWKS